MKEHQEASPEMKRRYMEAVFDDAWRCYCGRTALTNGQYMQAIFERCPFCLDQLKNFHQFKNLSYK